MIALWLALQLAHAGLTVEPAPRPDVESTVTLTDDEGSPRVGVTLRALVRPGLPGGRELGAGITDTRGHVRWTPDTPGPVVFRDGDEPVGAALVAWPSPPPSAWIPLLLLALAGAGALSWGRPPSRSP